MPVHSMMACIGQQAGTKQFENQSRKNGANATNRPVSGAAAVAVARAKTHVQQNYVHDGREARILAGWENAKQRTEPSRVAARPLAPLSQRPAQRREEQVPATDITKHAQTTPGPNPFVPSTSR